MLSHAKHALRELLETYRPVSTEFSAGAVASEDVSPDVARLAEEGTGGGEYAFLHEPGKSFRATGGELIDEPSYFHIVHHSVAGLPKYQNMEEIGAGEPVGMDNEEDGDLELSGGTLGDVLGGRPLAPKVVAGRTAEIMDGVAMANPAHGDWQDPQRKGIAPAIDAPEQPGDKSGDNVVPNSVPRVLPGMQILLALRSKRDGGGYVTEPRAARALRPAGAEGRHQAGIRIRRRCRRPRRRGRNSPWKPPPLSIGSPRHPPADEFQGEELHQKIANMYNNAIHTAPKSLAATVKGMLPANFLTGIRPADSGHQEDWHRQGGVRERKLDVAGGSANVINTVPGRGHPPRSVARAADHQARHHGHGIV